MLGMYIFETLILFAGFWVAHPIFVRIGIALVEAFRRLEKDNGAALQSLLDALIVDEDSRPRLLGVAIQEVPASVWDNFAFRMRFVEIVPRLTRSMPF